MTEAGADVVFVEAPESIDELRLIGRLAAPQVVNVVAGGKTPMQDFETFKAMGFTIVLYANAALQAMLLAAQNVLGSLKKTGSLEQVQDKLASFTERQRIVDKSFFDELESRYRGS